MSSVSFLKKVIRYVIINLSANWTPRENITYNIYVKVDQKDNVHEFNESNNLVFNRYPPLLMTDLPNVDLISADSNVTSIRVTSLDLSCVNETCKPEGISCQCAYMVNATGAGNFTLRFTNITDAEGLVVYKINETNQWIELNATSTGDTVIVTMEAGDPPVVFGSEEGIPSARAPALAPIGIVALIGLLTAIAVSRVKKKR